MKWEVRVWEELYDKKVDDVKEQTATCNSLREAVDVCYEMGMRDEEDWSLGYDTMVHAEELLGKDPDGYYLRWFQITPKE